MLRHLYICHRIRHLVPGHHAIHVWNQTVQIDLPKYLQMVVTILEHITLDMNGLASASM